MSELIVFFLTLLVVVLLLRWIRLVWFRAKTLRVMKYDLDYVHQIPSPQNLMFKEVTKSAISKKQNEYDAAIAFMISQFHILSTPLSKDGYQFVSEKLSKIHRIIPHSNVGLELYREFLRSGIYSG